MSYTQKHNRDSEMRELIQVLFLAWRMFPELRLGQLISNATMDGIYYVHDDEMKQNLIKYIQERTSHDQSNHDS